MADLGELVDRLLSWFTIQRWWTGEVQSLNDPPPLPREPSTGLRLVFLAGFVVIAAGAICLYLSDAVAAAGSWSQATLDAFGVGLVVGGLIDVLAIFGLNQILTREQKHRELRSQAEAILHDHVASPQERSDAAGEFLRRGHVNTNDPGVGVRTADEPSVERTEHAEVVDEEGFAGEQRRVFPADDPGPDDGAAGG